MKSENLLILLAEKQERNFTKNRTNIIINLVKGIVNKKIQNVSFNKDEKIYFYEFF